MGNRGSRCGDDSGGNIQELFGGHREHRVQRGGQLSASIGEVVTVTVGHFPNQAVITQEAEMASDAGGKLFVGSTGAPCGGTELLAQNSIGDA